MCLFLKHSFALHYIGLASISYASRISANCSLDDGVYFVMCVVVQIADILLFSKATYKCTVADIECELVVYSEMQHVFLLITLKSA